MKQVMNYNKDNGLLNMIRRTMINAIYCMGKRLYSITIKI